MGTKLQPGQHDCYAAALPDEPMFVLLARDPLAGFLVSIWSSIRNGDHEAAEVKFRTMLYRVGLGYCADPETGEASEALDCAMSMFAWRENNLGRWRRPVPPTHDVVGESGQLIEVDAEGMATVVRGETTESQRLHGGVRAAFLGTDPRHPGRGVISLMGGSQDQDGETADGVMFAMSPPGLQALAYALTQAAEQVRRHSVVDIRQII